MLIVGCSTTPKENNTTQTEIIQEPLISYPDPTSSDSWRIIFLEDEYDENLKLFRDMYLNQRAVRVIDKDTVWEKEFNRLYYDGRFMKIMPSTLEQAREQQKKLILSYVKASKPVKVIE